MLNKTLLTLSILLALFGCGKERIVDVSTAEQMHQKDILYIFPSIPEEYCYADSMTEILSDFNTDLNFVHTQMLSTPQAEDCTDYGFGGCEYLINERDGQAYAIACSSADTSKICLSFIGVEYKDVNGNMVEETCIMGADKI